MKVFADEAFHYLDMISAHPFSALGVFPIGKYEVRIFLL